jgi:hypothetical protein
MVIDRNLFLNNGKTNTGYCGEGLVAGANSGATSPIIITNNVFNGTSGLGMDTWEGLQGAVIANNTIINNGTGILITHTVTPNVVVRNNLFAGNSTNVGYDCSGSCTPTVDHNLCDRAGTGCQLVGDPRLANLSSGDAHLLAGSPAIDKGLPVSQVTTDFAGVARPQGSAYDIGAYEFGNSGPSPCDVNQDGNPNISDVQLAVNQVLNPSTCLPPGQPGSADINRDGQCTVPDVQRVVNAALGGNCVNP